MADPLDHLVADLKANIDWDPRWGGDDAEPDYPALAGALLDIGWRPPLNRHAGMTRSDTCPVCHSTMAYRAEKRGNRG